MEDDAPPDPSHQVIGLAIEVHRTLGPGLLESVYESCLCHELHLAAVPFARQQRLPLRYKNAELSLNYQVDLIVSGTLIVEIKSVTAITPVHEAQLLTYLRLSGIRLGLLLNFNTPVLKDGIKRRRL
jgi:hypothetical protein